VPDRVDDEPILSDNARAALQAAKNTQPVVEFAHGNPRRRLEIKQAEARRRHPPARPGNPNLKPGEYPYNMDRKPFERWLEKNFSPTGNFSIKEAVRMFLQEEIYTEDGTPGKRRFHRMLESLFERACDTKSPLQAQCASLLMDRAYGKAQASDADLDAIKKGGLTVVYVDRAAIDPDIPVVTLDAQQKALPEPEFIDAEVVDGIN